MKTTHTFGIQFVIRPGKEKETGLVYARITVESKRIEISLKKSFSLANWSSTRRIAKGTSV